MNASDQNYAVVQPNAEQCDWFTMPLLRDPQISVSAEQDVEWQVTDKTAYVFMGIIRHDDALEMVVCRKCDHAGIRDHNFNWPMRYHKRWRWDERQGLFFWSGYTPTVEEKDRIEQAIERKVSVLADPEHPEIVRQSYLNIPWKSGGAERVGASCTGLVWLWLAEQMGVKLDAPRLPATTGLAGVGEVSSATYFPKFNVLAGEAGREMMTVLAKPRFMNMGGMQAVIGNAGGNRLALTNADELAQRNQGGGRNVNGHIVLEVRGNQEFEARLVSTAVNGAEVRVTQNMNRSTRLRQATRAATTT